MKKQYPPFKHFLALLVLTCCIGIARAQFPAPYCGATFPSNNSDVGPITLVEFAGINNATNNNLLASGVNQLENFTNVTGSVNPGQTYTIRVKGNTAGSWPYYVTAFIDWNKNNTFDANEVTNVGIITGSTGIDAIQVTANIAVPAGAASGATRMRVTFKYNANATACNNSGWGQAEDYTILVGGSVPNNASVTAVLPANLGFCAGNQDIKARIKNTGNNIINYVTVNWEVDGVPQSPFFWGVPIDTAGGLSGKNDTLVVIGNTPFASGVSRNIKVWTSMPNGTQDTVYTDDSVSVSVTAKFNCAFLPTPCTPSFTSYTSCVGGNITNVNFAGINNTVACLSGGGYRDYTNSIVAPSVSPGQPLPVSVTIGTSSYRGGAAIWIDFNRNGTFDAAEQVFTGTYSGSNPTPYTYTGSITIPSSVTSGYLWMRVMGRENAIPTAPCGSGYGEAQDYLIYLVSKGPNNASVAAIEPADQSFCAGNQDIKARIRNNGDNIINNVTINWELDGILQTPVSWNTAIDTSGAPSGKNDTLITLGSVAFANAVPHLVKVWTSYPNFAADTVNTDDTMFVSIRNGSCLPPFPLPYCNVSAPTQVLPISLVKFATINNISSAAATTPPAIENFTSISANVLRGQSYPITIKGNTDGPYYYYATAFIDWNQNNVFTDPGETYTIGSVYSSTGSDAVEVTSNILVPQNAAYGATRMRLLLNWNTFNSGSCGITSGYGQAEDYTLVVAPRVNDNAGVTRLVSPVNYCAGSYDVKVRVANSGANIINYVTVNWELDGVLQTPAYWNFPIDTFGSVAGNDTVVTLGNVFFGAGVQHTIRAWTYLPNGVADTSTYDDTLRVSTKPSFSGTIVVGAAPSDYTTISAAISDLNAYGVCGPVEVRVRTGTYTGQQFQVNEIPGASEINTVTITSMANHRDSVLISNNSASSSNYVFKLNGSKYITIKNMSFAATNTTYGVVGELTGGVAYDTITNCKLTSSVTSGSSTTGAVLYAGVLSGKNIIVDNNSLINGGYGIYWLGTSSLYIDSSTISNNTIQNSSYAAAYLNYNSNFAFKDNTITTAAGASYGLYYLYSNGSFEMSGNRISGQNASYGAYVRYLTGSSTVRPLIANNSIAVGNGGSGTGYALWCRDINYGRIYHNTLNVFNTGANSVAGYFYFNLSSTSNNEIKNNVFANNGGNYAMYNYMPVNGPCNYNNLYSTSATSLVQALAGNYATIAAWKATGQDAMSVSYRPGFTSNSNLTPNVTDSAVWSLNGRALHLADVVSSVNKLTRPATYSAGAPDIGAYEFTPQSLPPAAVATPATPSAGSNQVFMFAGDTVAVISWQAFSNTPPAFALRQHSGQKPAIVSGSDNYTNVFLSTDMAPGFYNYVLDMPYREGWRGTVTNESDIRLISFTNTMSWQLNNTSTVDPAANKMNGGFFQEWQYFMGTDQYYPLPVRWISFNANVSGEDVLLQWNTGAEANNKGFEVERSFDGKNFTSIGFVKARNSLLSNRYEFNDQGAFANEQVPVLIYRLKQVDHNGESAYSPLVVVNRVNANAGQVTVYPNPYIGNFVVNFSSAVAAKALIEVYDITGKNVYSMNAETSQGMNSFMIDELSELNKGVYFVKVTSEGRTSTLKVIKRN